MKYVWAMAVLSMVVFCRGNDQNKITLREDWEAPDDIKRAFPYYVSGRDKEGCIVYVIEVGNWDIVRIARSNEQQLQVLNNHILKLVQIILKPRTIVKNGIRSNSSKLVSNSTPNKLNLDEDERPGAALIVDLQGLQRVSEAQSTLIKWYLQQARMASAILEQTEYLYFINTPALANIALTIIRPALGQLSAKVETFGTNKERWIPKLLEKIDKDQLPEWYGGTKNFRPLAYYG